ncbi:hypothetical protein NM2001072_2120 [Neisseria meningitidis 2001072]|nr:hypothetical protein NM2001072_2120 [Neisseria meningitidis 2001072]
MLQCFVTHRNIKLICIKSCIEYMNKFMVIVISCISTVILLNTVQFRHQANTLVMFVNNGGFIAWVC